MPRTQAAKDAEKRYRESHREELNAKRREYNRQRRLNDPDWAKKESERVGKWQKENKDKYNAGQRNWKQKNYIPASQRPIGKGEYGQTLKEL